MSSVIRVTVDLTVDEDKAKVSPKALADVSRALASNLRYIQAPNFLEGVTPTDVGGYGHVHKRHDPPCVELHGSHTVEDIEE